MRNWHKLSKIEPLGYFIYYKCEECGVIVYEDKGEYYISDANEGKSNGENIKLGRYTCKEWIIRGIIE